MMHSSLEFQVQQLRMKSVVKTLEAVSVFMLSLFCTAYLPSILMRYVYAGQPLMEQPKLLEFLPIVAFALGVAYFVFAMVGNILREMQAAKLEKDHAEMAAVWGHECCGECDHHHMDEMKHDEPINDTKAMAAALAAPKKTATKTAKTKKARRK